LEFGFYNMDCIEGMKQFPDKYFDIAIVDPPYGGGAKEDAQDTFKGAIYGRFGGTFEKYIKAERTGGGYFEKYGKDIAKWDIAPPKEYFEELFRVSKNQIIWGGITSSFRQHDALSFGEKQTFLKILQWPCASMRGHHITTTRKCLSAQA